MRLTVNGETREAPDSATLAELVAALGIDGRRVAVERNREIAPRSLWPQIALQDGDQLEIVQFVGGRVMTKRVWRGPVTEPPTELAAILEHMMLRPLKTPDGSSIPDLGLDKKAVKARFERQALIACSSFLLCASNERLKIEFRPHVSDEAWRTAMGPDDELERIHYLAGRVGADMMRAAGVSP